MGEINTKLIAENWKEELKLSVASLPTKPCLAIVVAKGYSDASTKYVNNKIKVAKEIGIEILLKEIEWEDRSKEDTYCELVNVISQLNLADCVNGIIVQLPFVDIPEKDISELIEPSKDVDGFTSIQKGKLVDGDADTLIPCTALGIMRILENTHSNLNGKTMAIINRSNLIGKPLIQLALNKNMTPIVVHTKTNYNSRVFALNNSNIIVSGCGKRKLFNAYDIGNYIETIIDCSMTPQDGIKGVGDFDKESILENKPNVSIASGYGHTGLTTVVALMNNVILAYKNQMAKEKVDLWDLIKG